MPKYYVFSGKLKYVVDSVYSMDAVAKAMDAYFAKPNVDWDDLDDFIYINECGFACIPDDYCTTDEAIDYLESGEDE
tara:strand:+ start:4413 stop:4643 length:231 start_codon:yes stop_codon:yes gene_type:complete